MSGSSAGLRGSRSGRGPPWIELANTLVLLLGLAGEAHRALDDSRMVVQCRYCDAFGQLVDASAAAPKSLPRDRRTITTRPSGGGAASCSAPEPLGGPQAHTPKGEAVEKTGKGNQGEAFP